MEPPSIGGHIQQFLCAIQWVKTGIPNFAQIISPLHDFMERIYEKAGKPTKLAVSAISLDSLGWGQSEQDAFERCKNALLNIVTLPHRNEIQRLCIYTDNSDTCRSDMVTQVPVDDLSLPHKEQRHVQLALCPGRYNATQLGCSTLEKKVYAIMDTLERMHWLAPNAVNFYLHTDHNNLIFLFEPLSLVPDLSQSSTRKVLRWAVRLSVYLYTCVHINGLDNEWADMMTRWPASKTVRRLLKIPELPTTNKETFKWTSLTELIEAQHEHINCWCVRFERLLTS